MLVLLLLLLSLYRSTPEAMTCAGRLLSTWSEAALKSAPGGANGWSTVDVTSAAAAAAAAEAAATGAAAEGAAGLAVNATISGSSLDGAGSTTAAAAAAGPYESSWAVESSVSSAFDLHSVVEGSATESLGFCTAGASVLEWLHTTTGRVQATGQ